MISNKEKSILIHHECIVYSRVDVDGDPTQPIDAGFYLLKLYVYLICLLEKYRLRLYFVASDAFSFIWI